MYINTYFFYFKLSKKYPSLDTILLKSVLYPNLQGVEVRPDEAVDQLLRGEVQPAASLQHPAHRLLLLQHHHQGQQGQQQGASHNRSLPYN
jgi:hypothetical protein